MSHLERAFEYLEYCRNLIIRLSFAYDLDADDVGQDMFLFIVDLLEKRDVSLVRNIRSYIYACVRQQIFICAYDRPPRPMSLSCPGLAETLAVPASGAGMDMKLCQVLYQALRKQPIVRQRALKEFFQLSDFRPHANGRRRYLKKLVGSPGDLRRYAYRELRQDQQLLQAVQA